MSHAPRHCQPEDLRKWRRPGMEGVSMKKKTGVSQAFSGNTRRPSILNPAHTLSRAARFGKPPKSDRPGYSCERTPWVLVTGAEPLNSWPACVLNRIPCDGMEPTFRHRRPETRMQPDMEKMQSRICFGNAKTKKETTLLSPLHARSAKVARSRISKSNKPQIGLTAKS